MAHLFICFALLFPTAYAYYDNCHDSNKCNNNMRENCRAAWARFTDTTIYDAYTSVTYGNCAATYHCMGDYFSLTGAQLKVLFEPIYEGQGCRGCGDHAFNDGNCAVSLNYCHVCFDSGISD